VLGLVEKPYVFTLRSTQSISLSYRSNALRNRRLKLFFHNSLALAQGVLSNWYNNRETPMKINMIPTNKLAMLSAAVCAVMLAFTNNASALTIGDTHELGTVSPAVPFGDAEATAYVNELRQMALNTTEPFNGNTLTRSGNDFGPLPAPVLLQHVNAPVGGFPGQTTTISLGAQGTYTYLFAKYDAGNTFSEVWYVGNLSGDITIPNFNGVYGLSAYILFGPGGGQVPDGGTTVMLLGTALGALGMVRRFLMG
jgi:hypothetical protein